MQGASDASIIESVILLRSLRNAFLRDISTGAVLPADIGACVATEPALASIYAVKVAEAIPGLGKVTARRALGRHGVDELSPAGEVDPQVWSSIAVTQSQTAVAMNETAVAMNETAVAMNEVAN
jgi:hypothetical protein